MPFTANMSTAAAVDDSVMQAYDAAFILANGQSNVMDQFVQYRQDIGAKAIELPKFSRIAVATTPLTEDEDAASTALADTKIVLTPKEYGAVVTRTNLASLQTGGKADLAAATVVGTNWGQTMDKLAILALDAGTAVSVDGGLPADYTAGDVATVTFLNTLYNKLARASVPMINGAYVFVAHDDVIHDLRIATGAGSWLDVTKYATPEAALRNEVGMLGGFRIVRDNQATFADQAGAGTVDVYNSYAFGFNALGKAVSQPGRLTFTGPFDKLGRFVNVGWYEVCEYKIIDSEAIFVGQCASSVGANAA
jgi:N4-gp56 family major capsid protein